MSQEIRIRFLTINHKCPNCGTAPRLRISELERERYFLEPPELPVLTYRCHRQGCTEIYEITARHIQRSA